MTDIGSLNQDYGLVDQFTPIHFVAGVAIGYGTRSYLATATAMLAWEWWSNYFDPDNTTPTLLGAELRDKTPWGSLTDILVGTSGGVLGVWLRKRYPWRSKK